MAVLRCRKGLSASAACRQSAGAQRTSCRRSSSRRGPPAPGRPASALRRQVTVSHSSRAAPGPAQPCQSLQAARCRPLACLQLLQKPFRAPSSRLRLQVANPQDEGFLAMGAAGHFNTSRCGHSRPERCLQLQSCEEPLTPQEPPQLLLQARQAPRMWLQCCGGWCGACWCWLLAAGAAQPSGLPLWRLLA